MVTLVGQEFMKFSGDLWDLLPLQIKKGPAAVGNPLGSPEDLWAVHSSRGLEVYIRRGRLKHEAGEETERRRGDSPSCSKNPNHSVWATCSNKFKNTMFPESEKVLQNGNTQNVAYLIWNLMLSKMQAFLECHSAECALQNSGSFWSVDWNGTPTVGVRSAS